MIWASPRRNSQACQATALSKTPAIERIGPFRLPLQILPIRLYDEYRLQTAFDLHGRASQDILYGLDWSMIP